MTILEGLSKGLYVRAFLVVPTKKDRQTIRSQSLLHVRWRVQAQRPDTMSIRNMAMQDMAALVGPGQVWLAGEARWVEAWRAYWLNNRRLHPATVCEVYLSH